MRRMRLICSAFVAVAAMFGCCAMFCASARPVMAIGLWAFEGIDISSSMVDLGDSVEVMPVVRGETDDLTFNYVWSFEGAWESWSSTVKETGGNTSDAQWSFRPKRAGWYRLYVDVFAPDGSKETKSVDVTVDYPYLLDGMNVSASEVELGNSVVVSPYISGNSAGVRYNYVWQYGDTWDEWSSTIKAIGEPTGETSWTFTPTKSGVYHLALDIYHIDGVKETLTADLRVDRGWSVGGLELDAPSRITPGTVVDYRCTVDGDASSYVRFNYVWQRNNWAEWSSTLLETGGYVDAPLQSFTFSRSGKYVLYIDVYDTRSGESVTVERSVTVYPTDYSFAGVRRSAVVSWLENHQTSYYLGTPYRWTVRVDDCTYPLGSPRWDGFTGMNCAGFVAHAYRSCGADLASVTAATSFIPAGITTRGEYVNAWRWRGCALAAGAQVFTYDSAAELLAGGLAEKGDLVFFEPYNTATTDCHIGFFWGETSNQNLFWHSDPSGNRISELVNVAGPSRLLLIKGVPVD